MPTSAIVTYGAGRLIPIIAPNDALRRAVNLATGTYASGTVVGEVTATPGTFGAYASGHSDGTQNARGALEYACVVDGSGNITIGGTGAAGGEWAQTRKDTSMFINGYFSAPDLVGLDATALAALGRQIEGTGPTVGIVLFTGA